MRSRRAASIQTLAAIVLLVSTHSGEGQPPTPSAVAREKHQFIVKAMAQEREAADATLRELAKRGIRPLMLPPPMIVPFGDWDYYYLKDGTLTWLPNPGQQFKEVIVPVGFVSDLASIPRLFWSAIRPEGRHAYAAIVHDYLYWSQDRPREEADQIFRIAMEDSKVAPTTVRTIYEAVRLGGGSAWNENARRKKEGEKRLLRLFPGDFTTSWEEWKRRPDVFAD